MPPADVTAISDAIDAMHRGRGQQVSAGGMYLYLFNARKCADTTKTNWMPDGPAIGPLVSAHEEWGETLRLKFLNPADAERFELDPKDPVLRIDNDMVLCHGTYYSDWIFQAGTRSYQ